MFVCVSFYLVWFLTFHDTQESTEFMYNSVVGLFFLFISIYIFGCIFYPLELFLFALMGVNGKHCAWQNLLKLTAHSKCNSSNNFSPKRYETITQHMHNSRFVVIISQMCLLTARLWASNPICLSIFWLKNYQWISWKCYLISSERGFISVFGVFFQLHFP